MGFITIKPPPFGRACVILFPSTQEANLNISISKITPLKTGKHSFHFSRVFAGWEVEDERDESLLQIQESGTPPGPDLSNEKFGLGGWLEGMIGHEIVPSYTKLYRNYYKKQM